MNKNYRESEKNCLSLYRHEAATGNMPTNKLTDSRQTILLHTHQYMKQNMTVTTDK